MSVLPARVAPTPSLWGRLRGALVEAASALACRLPEPPLIALAGLAGEVWLRADPRRAEQGRRNLRRVCVHLAATGTGPELARRAASDPGALESLLRSASRHHARYYLEVLRTPAMVPERVRRIVVLDDPDGKGAFDRPGALVIIGLHFGALEIPALFLSDRLRRPAVAPMETIADPVLQAWLERTRSLVDLRIVPIAAARGELLGTLGRGGIAGVVADRDIHGGGIEVSLFGAPAPLPIGGALVAIESGAPAYVMGARRAGRGTYRAAIVPVEIPAEGGRRERVTTFLERQAAAYEWVIAMAPDQWWAIFFPIWRDLAVTPRRETAADGTAR